MMDTQRIREFIRNSQSFQNSGLHGRMDTSSERSFMPSRVGHEGVIRTTSNGNSVRMSSETTNPGEEASHSRQLTRVSGTRARTSAPRVGSGTVNPSIHPQFRSKAVCQLFCQHCTSLMCHRGMRAILLGNTAVELYSTDLPPDGVQLVYTDYQTQNCACRIRDAACLGCGNIVGYHVTQPCERCLDSCNNGHFWMFLSEAIRPVERVDRQGAKILRWASLPLADKDQETVEQQCLTTLCR